MIKTIIIDGKEYFTDGKKLYLKFGEKLVEVEKTDDTDFPHIVLTEQDCVITKYPDGRQDVLIKIPCLELISKEEN